MRITRIAAQNFLSFENLSVADLDPQLNVVVGPNGSGKSNLVRLLSVIQDTAGWPSHANLAPEDLLPLRRLSTTNGFSLALDLELTEDRERNLVVEFLRGAFMSSEESFPTELKQWAEKAFQAAPSFLFAGTLVVALPDTSSRGLDVTYECETEGIRLRWSVGEGLGRPSTNSPKQRPVDAFFRARQAGSVPEGLSALFSRSDPITLELRPDRLRDSPEILQSLGNLVGEPLDLSGSRFYTVAWVFHHLFRQGLHLTDNIRVPPRLTWSAKDLTRSPLSLNLRDGSELPLYLFRLSMGDAQQRETYADICGRFKDLTDWPLEITLKPRMPRARQTYAAARPTGLPEQSGDFPQEQEQLEIELVPVVKSTKGDVPIEFAGAGAWEAAVLSAFLAAPSGVLVLDEPALNLHPVRQRRLLRMLRSWDGQVVSVTHSPYMVPSDDVADLRRIIRLDLQQGTSRVFRATAGATAGREQQNLLRWLSELTEVRSFLFARGVVLVEGGTEQGALSTWFAKSLEARKRGAPEDLNLLLFSVGGDQNFRPFIALLAAFGIPWAVVCDGKVFRDRQEKGESKTSVFRQLAEVGVQLEQTASKPMDNFEEAKSIGATCGVFTLAQDFSEELEDYLKSNLAAEHEAATKEWPKSKVLAGRMVAQQTDCPAEVDVLYARILDWLNLPQRAAV